MLGVMEPSGRREMSGGRAREELETNRQCWDDSSCGRRADQPAVRSTMGGEQLTRECGASARRALQRAGRQRRASFLSESGEEQRFGLSKRRAQSISFRLLDAVACTLQTYDSARVQNPTELGPEVGGSRARAWASTGRQTRRGRSRGGNDDRRGRTTSEQSAFQNFTVATFFGHDAGTEPQAVSHAIVSSQDSISVDFEQVGPISQPASLSYLSTLQSCSTTAESLKTSISSTATQRARFEGNKWHRILVE